MDIHNISMVRMNFTTEVSIACLEKPSFTVIFMKINGVVQIKHTLNSVHEKFTLHCTKHHLTFIGMVKFLLLIKSEFFNVTSIPSHQNLRNYTTEQKKDNSCVIPTADQKLNGGIHTPRNSSTNHIQILMSITIILEKVGPMVPTC